MGGATLKLPSLKMPSFKLNLPRPTRWDLYALGALVAGLALAGANIASAASRQPGEPSSLTPLFVVAQLVVACGGLLLLGKTAKEGTAWGNLFSIGAMLVGMSGVLLAAALWATL